MLCLWSSIHMHICIMPHAIYLSHIYLLIHAILMCLTTLNPNQNQYELKCYEKECIILSSNMFLFAYLINATRKYFIRLCYFLSFENKNWFCIESKIFEDYVLTHARIISLLSISAATHVYSHPKHLFCSFSSMKLFPSLFQLRFLAHSQPFDAFC